MSHQTFAGFVAVNVAHHHATTAGSVMIKLAENVLMSCQQYPSFVPTDTAENFRDISLKTPGVVARNVA